MCHIGQLMLKAGGNVLMKQQIAQVNSLKLIAVPTFPDSRDSKTKYASRQGLFSKEPSHPPQHAIFLWIIRMVFAGNLENGRKWIAEPVHGVSNLLGNLYIISVSSSSYCLC